MVDRTVDMVGRLSTMFAGSDGVPDRVGQTQAGAGRPAYRRTVAAQASGHGAYWHGALETGEGSAEKLPLRKTYLTK